MMKMQDKQGTPSRTPSSVTAPVSLDPFPKGEMGAKSEKNRLKIPAIPLYIVKQMPTGYEKLVGMTLQNVEQKTTAIMLNGTRDETMMINSLVHELRHAWQHMYHQDWFDDYNINLPLENYFDQITECDAAAYAYLFTFYSCGLRLEPSVGQEKVLQRVRELEKEDLFW